MADEATKPVIHFGKGEKGKFIVTDLLTLVNAPQDYFDAIGNGLNIGGLNIGTPDKVIGIPEETTELMFMAPGKEPVSIPCVCDVPERTEEEEAEIQARRSGKAVAEEAKEEVVPDAPSEE